MCRIAIVLLLAVAASSAVAADAVTAQVTCSACWSEADRATVPYGGEEDQACARRCDADGIPQALAVRDGDGRFRLLTLRGGPPAPHESWLDLIGAFVEADVEPARRDTVRVTSLTVLERSPWPAPEGAGDAAPIEARTWPDLTGAEQSLAAYRGRVVVVNFWATWCAPCIEEMPVLAGVQADYGPLGVQVVGIAADEPRRAKDVLAFARDAGVTFPVWLGATTADMAALGVGPALPATVVLDRDGRVAHRVAGVVTAESLRERIDAVLAPGGDLDAALRDTDHAHGHTHATRPGEAALVPS